MAKIFIINGCGAVGKGTFVEYVGNYCNVKQLSSVDIVKDAAIILGWTGSKDERDRKFLSDLKSLSVKYNNFPARYIVSKIQSNLNDYDAIFVDIREPEEIDKLKNFVGAKTILVKNNRIKPIETNESDKNVENYDYDYVIENNGTFDELNAIAKEFANNAIIKKC